MELDREHAETDETAGFTFNGEALVSGTARGRTLVTREPLSFWGGYHPETGDIIDRRHPLFGENGAGKILVFPGTRGSSTTTAVLLEAIRRGVAPAGFVVTDRDTFLTLAAVVAEEMYQRTLPLILASPTQFQAIQEARGVTIRPDGTVTAAPA